MHFRTTIENYIHLLQKYEAIDRDLCVVIDMNVTEVENSPLNDMEMHVKVNLKPVVLQEVKHE